MSGRSGKSERPFAFYRFFPPFGAPAWLTDTVLPATVTDPFRPPPLVEETLTVAEPDPEPAPATFSHCVEPAGVHAQPVLVVTETGAVPPAEVKLIEVGVTV